MLRKMPGGPLQERLRDWVRERLKRRRGASMALARHIKKEPSWVTLYSAGVRDADLDTAVGIASYFGVSLVEILGDAPLPLHAPDTQIEAKAQAFEKIQELMDRFPLPPMRERSPRSVHGNTPEREGEDQATDQTAKPRQRFEHHKKPK